MYNLTKQRVLKFKDECVSILNMSLCESARPQISEGWLTVVGCFTQLLETPLNILTCRLDVYQHMSVFISLHQRDKTLTSCFFCWLCPAPEGLVLVFSAALVQPKKKCSKSRRFVTATPGTAGSRELICKIYYCC